MGGHGRGRRRIRGRRRPAAAQVPGGASKAGHATAGPAWAAGVPGTAARGRCVPPDRPRKDELPQPLQGTGGGPSGGVAKARCRPPPVAGVPEEARRRGGRLKLKGAAEGPSVEETRVWE